MGLVQHPQKGAPLFFGAHGFRQLQISPGVHVQLHEFAAGVVLQLADVGQVIFLQGQQGLQQGAAGDDGGGEGGKAQLLQRGTKMGLKQLGAGLQPEEAPFSLVHAAA